MKSINYLFGLMLGIGLFSCTDDQLLDKGQNGDKTYQKIEATMEVKNAVIGIGGEAPATRGGQYVGNLNENSKDLSGKVEDSDEVGDIIGYLKYAFRHKTINKAQDKIELGEYEKKTKMNADLIIGMECDGQYAYFHLAGEKKLTILDDDDNVASIAQLTMAEAGTEGRPGNVVLNLKDPSQFTNKDRNQPVIVADDYEQFVKNVRANKQGLKVYVSAIAGGNFICKEARNHYAPTQDFDPDRPYIVKKQMVDKDGKKYMEELKESEWPKMPFFSGINEDNNGTNTAKKRDAVPMDIPLTTQGWEQIGSNRVQYANGKWTIDLSDIEINLKPSGSLIAFSLKNNAKSEGDNRGDKNAAAHMKPTEAWLTSFEMKPVFSSDLKIPMSTNVEMSKKWGGREEIKDCDSFIGFGKIYLNGRYSGNMEAGKYSRPIYFWAHGNGDLMVTFRCFKKRYNTKDREKDGGDVDAVYPGGDEWYQFFSQDNPNTVVGYSYGPNGYQMEFYADFNKMQEGKSYLCRFDDEKDVNNDGLIMTEIFMPKEVTGEGKANYEGYTMLEVYNPTDHPIDLRKYGLIRQYDYKHYVKDGKGKGYKGCYPDLKDAKIQVLYVDDTKTPVYTMGGDVVEGVPNLFRQAPESGNYIPFLQPGKTAVYLAAKWVDEHLFVRDPQDFRNNQDAKNGVYGERIPIDLHNMMFKNIDNGNCQFIVSLRNGVGKIDHKDNTSALEMGWFDNMHLTGLLLVQKKSNKWGVVDVFGITENDDPILEKFRTKKERMLDTGVRYTQKAFGKRVNEPFEKYFDQYNICIIRNNRPGDDKQNLRFIKDDESLVIGEDRDKHLWLIRPFSWDLNVVDNPFRKPYGVSFGSRWEDSKN